MTIAAHIPNLFDRPRFGDRVTFVDSGAEAEAIGARLLFVDLGRCADLWEFRIRDTYVVGFGPHEETGLLRTAGDCGYDEVLARSVFFRRLPEFLAPEFTSETV